MASVSSCTCASVSDDCVPSLPVDGLGPMVELDPVAPLPAALLLLPPPPREEAEVALLAEGMLEPREAEVRWVETEDVAEEGSLMMAPGTPGAAVPADLRWPPGGPRSVRIGGLLGFLIDPKWDLEY